MDIKDIVEGYLKKNKFDGLYNTLCGCFLNDLMPCNSVSGNCKPGHKKTVDGELGIVTCE